ELELTKVANMQEIAALQLKKITDAQSSERLRLEAEALRLKSASAEEKNTETALVARELKLNKTADTQSVKASQLSEVARQQDVRKLELDRVTKEQSTEKSRLEALTKELAVEKARLKEAENKVVAAELKLQKEAERKADEELRSKKAEEKKIVDELRLKKAAERKAAEKLKSEEDEKIEAERKEIAKLKQEQDRIEKEKKRAEAIQKRFDNAGSEFIKLYAGKKVELDTIFSSLHAKIIPENKRIDVLNADYQILADFYILFDMLNDLRNKESLAETSMIFIVYQHACLMRKAYLSKNLLNSHETVKAFLLNFLKVYESTPVQFNETLTEIVNKLSYHYGLLKNLQMKCKLQEIVLSPETTELTGAVSQRILLLVNSLIQNEIHNIKHVISKEDHRYIVDNVKKIQDEISAALLSVPKNQLVEEAPDAKLLTAVQAGLFKANALIAERRASIDKKVAEYSAIYSRKKDCLAANMAVFNQHSTSTLVRHNLFVSYQVVTDTCDLIARGVDAAE
ncbi:MAG: hypothetical protein NTU49_02370, partial [Gammaproteobacteria bacterium]|nr:hypothetical protein [Gammaproteobacteria bacterium]